MPPVELAVIAAAGLGSRLGLGRPKCLVQVGGRTLIEHQLDLLVDVPEVRVVVGYHEADVVAHVAGVRPDAIFVRNPRYAKSNTIHSLRAAVRHRPGWFLAIDGDLLIEPASMSRFLHQCQISDGPLLAVCRSGSDDAVFVTTERRGGHETITGFQRTPSTDLEWSGMARLHSDHLSSGDGFVYEALTDHLPLGAAEIVANEIDTPDDLARARNAGHPAPPAWLEAQQIARTYWSTTSHAALGPADLYQNQRTAISELFTPLLGTDDRVLDVGCGDGRFTLEVAPHCRAVVGYDLSPTLIEQANQAALTAAQDNTSFAVADAAVTPFGDGWDHVVSMGLLTTICDPAAFESIVARLATAVRPGGHVLLKDSVCLDGEQLRVDGTYAAIYRNEAAYLRAFAEHGLELVERRRLAQLPEGHHSVLWLLRRPEPVPVVVGRCDDDQVSVVLYVHNGERYLAGALRSILDQTHDRFELCVVDDGSTDATASILDEAVADPRVRVERQERRGRDRLHETFNHGLTMARHELLAVANADDVWLPTKLETQVSALRAEPEIDVCWHDATLIDAEGVVTLGGFWRIPSLCPTRELSPRRFIAGDPVPNPTTLFRRAILDVIGLQETGWMHDYQFWFKAAIHRCRFLGLPDRLIRYRVHENSHSTSSRRAGRIAAEAHTMVDTMVRRHGLDGLYPELALAGGGNEPRAYAHTHLGVLLWDGGHTDLAMSHWVAAMGLTDNPAPHFDAGIAAWSAGDVAEGRRHITAAANAGLPSARQFLSGLTDGTPLTAELVVWHGVAPPFAALVDEATTVPRARAQLPRAERLWVVGETIDLERTAAVLGSLVGSGGVEPSPATVILTSSDAATAAVAHAFEAVVPDDSSLSIDLLQVHPDELASVVAAHRLSDPEEIGSAHQFMGAKVAATSTS